MESKKDANWMKYIEGERIYLGLYGYYPLAKDKYIIPQRMAAIFFIAVFTIYFTLGCVYAAQNVSNVELFSTTCAFILTDLANTVKILNLLYHKKNILLFEDMLRDPLFTEIDEEEEVIVRQSLKLSKMINTTWVGLIFANIVYEMIYPLVSHKFFLLMWFPFNPEEHFYKVYLFDTLTALSGASIGTTIDMLFVLCLDLCAVQFVLLKHRLMKLSSTFTRDAAEDDRIRVEKLKKYIAHHSYIYRFCSLVEQMLSIGIFCQIVCSSMIICFSLFQVLVTPVKSMRFALVVGYAFDMLWELSIYCYFGQKVLNSSDEITEACYMSQWYTCSLEIQKYLTLMMSRANTPVIIVAGGIFPLTLETLMAILSTAYSFFALIWKMYNEN